MVESFRIQRYIPLILIAATAVTVLIQLTGNPLSVHGDPDSIIVLFCILVIAAVCFVYARKLNYIHLDLGLALFIYAMSVVLVQKFIADLTLLQKIPLAGIFLLSFICIVEGIFRARRLADERIEMLSRQKAELVQLSGDLEQANAKLRLLSQVTRHDISNQLTLLRGYLKILEKKQPELATSEYFRKTVMAAQRISSEIQFTREYESIGVQAPVWQECRTLVDLAAEQASLGTIRLTNELPRNFEIFSDPLIVKVFYNLLDNAVRYGGRITKIRISLCRDGNSCRIVCEDDGGGIPQEEKEIIFDRGFGKNTGLGLTMSREILGITGICICETGEPGCGARFELMVPPEAYRFSDE